MSRQPAAHQPAAKLAYLLLPLLLAAGVVLLVAASVQRQVASFQPVGARFEAEGGAFRVSAVDGPGVGLRQGDRVYSVNGRVPESVAELREALVGRPESDLLVQRGPELVAVSYLRPALDVDFPYVVLALIGAVYLAIGLYTVFKRRRRQAVVFYLWCLTSAAAYLLTTAPPFDAVGRAIHIADGVALALLAPLTLHLFLIFPSPLFSRQALGRFVAFLYLPAAVLVALQLDLGLAEGRFVFGPPSPSSVRLFDSILIYHLVLGAALALAAHGRRLRRTTNVEEKRQLRWIGIGLAGGYLPFALLEAVPRALSLDWPELVTTTAVLPLALVPLTFAYAILRYKLWDIEVIVRNAIAYTLTLLLGVLTFSLANLAISRGVPEDLALLRNLLSFGTGLAIAGLVLPTRRSIGASLDRIQYRTTFAKRRSLVDLGRELLHQRDLDRLCSELLDRLQEGMELDAVNLYLHQGRALVPVRPDPALPAQIPTDTLGEEIWDREVASIPATDLPATAPSATQRLFMAGYRHAFPLVVRGSRVGLVLTGYKPGQTPLASNDVELIRGVLNQASLAIENAQLLDQLHHQLEEVLRLKRYNEGIVESSPAGIAVLDGGGRVASANLAFAALVGRERREVLGKTFGELLAIELPRPGDGLVETSLKDEDGKDRYFQTSVAALAEGPGAGRLVILQDVTSRVAMETELKEKDRLAALGMLAAGVAHEVNTPITGISSYAQLLLEDTPEDDPRHGLLKKVENQTFRAARIVNNLLEFARDRSSEMRPVDLGPALSESLLLLSERFEECGIEVRWEPPEEAVEVQGSEPELQQVFTNLLVNAADAMQDGGSLTVELASEAGQARVQVTDTGPGIPPDQLDKVFQPFFSTKLAQGGTGLGLSISFEIVRRHGGEIRVVSDPGEGCRFIVELPRLGDA